MQCPCNLADGYAAHPGMVKRREDCVFILLFRDRIMCMRFSAVLVLSWPADTGGSQPRKQSMIRNFASNEGLAERFCLPPPFSPDLL